MNIARALALLATTAVTAVTACSFVLTRTEGQCNSHADCAARGGAFVNSACSESHVCVALPAPSTGDGGGSCTQNLDCAGANALSLCRAGVCVKLNGEGCTSQNLGQTVNNAVPIGFFTTQAQSGGTLDDTVDIAHVATVAINELARAANTPNLKDLPPVVGVVCDQTKPEAADHLLNKLGVRVVIGGPADSAALTALLDVTRKAGAILLSPSADDPALEATPNPNADGLFWSFRPNRMRQLPFFADAIRKALELAKLPADAPVLIAAGTDASTSNFVDRFQVGDAGVTYTVFKSPSRLDPTFVSYDALAQQIVTQKPALVVAASSVERWDDIITAVEKGWPGGTRPFYLLMDKNSAVEKQLPILDAQCSGCAIAARVMGLTPHHDGALYDAFVRAFTVTNGSAPTYGPERGYDAVYEATYALVQAAKDAKVDFTQVTPQGFKSAIAAFNGPDGLPRNTGSIGIPDVVSALGQKMNLTGASGSLDFDVSKGTPAGDSEIYCVVKQKFCDTGIVFKSDTPGPPSGTNACDCLH